MIMLVGCKINRFQITFSLGNCRLAYDLSADHFYDTNISASVPQGLKLAINIVAKVSYVSDKVFPPVLKKDLCERRK